jgi:hypothetical protein
MIPRTQLWNKLLENNINGKFFRIIYQMYEGIKSLVYVNNKKSMLFSCDKGVRQGENLSPVLFSLYLNDLENYLLNHDCKGVASIPANKINPLDIGFHLLCLLYADDTALLATSANELQHTLTIFNQYCNKWKLKINITKTKVLIFNGNTKDYKYVFKIGNTILENVKEYKYLGATFTKSNNFKNTKIRLKQQATKAMYFVLAKAKDHQLSVECKLKMFDSMILPILLYGCEIWGYENNDIYNSVQINFIRHILPVKKGTPFFMLYGELGRMPVELIIHRRMICYWARVISGKQSKLSLLLYKAMIKDNNINGINYKWITFIKQTLDHLGMSNIWISQTFLSVKWLSQQIKTRQNDQYLQTWRNNISQSSRGNTYELFKEKLNFENYFNIIPEKLWTVIIKFRTSNHYLPIETGRWNNVLLEDRLCALCDEHTIGDEFHYLFSCKYFRNARLESLHPHYYTRPNIYKFRELMASKKISTLKKLAKFINKILQTFKRPSN